MQAQARKYRTSSLIEEMGTVVQIQVLHNVRCVNCGRKLAELQGTAQLKCPKCGCLATYKI